MAAQGLGAVSKNKKPTIKKLDEDDGNCYCPCELSGGSCIITFKYTNSNAIQDSSFDFYLIKPDGSEKFIGNINALCKNYVSDPGDPPCQCAEVDVFSFDTVIKQEDLIPCEVCAVQWRSELVHNNLCGTLGIFEILGPYGSVPDAGNIGGSGLIKLRDICINPEANG